jgi:ATP-dependent exoDNAse (exonuclease V) beta subunit
MTIHKAKGLEFDVVILPGLHHLPPKQEQQLLLWMVRPRTHQRNDLILAPIKEVTYANDPVYNYLRRKNEVRNQLEETRLFYVAATRAKNQLHLIGNLDYATEDDAQLKSPVNKSFLRLIWPSVQQNFIAAINNNQISTTNNKETKIGNTINHPRRLLLPNNDLDYQKSVDRSWIVDLTTDFRDNRLWVFEKLLNNTSDAQYIGTVIHKILYQISIDGIAQWPTQRIHANKNHWSNMLLQLGINPTQLESAIQQINTAIQNTINDSRGQWILTDHVNAKSEFAISTNKDNCLQRLVIDRTFIDIDNNVWIIDYKTTKYNGNQLARFLAAEKEKHQRQLENYANVLHKLYTKLSVNTHYNNICFGLYFPLITAWIDWH